MKKRPAPVKREFRTMLAQGRRLTCRERVYPARVFRLQPDPSRRGVVELRIVRNRRQYMAECRRWHTETAHYIRSEGLCKSYTYRHHHRKDGCTWFRGVTARIILYWNAWKNNPNEITPHECVHAAMAWARLRRVDVRKSSDDEEVLAYAAGELTRQCIIKFFIMKRAYG